MTVDYFIKTLLSLFLIIVLGSCVEEPTFSSTPNIQFIGANYVIDGDDRSFNISFSFQDQEGDIFTDNPIDLLVVSRTARQDSLIAYYQSDTTVLERRIRSEFGDNLGKFFVTEKPEISQLNDCDDRLGTFSLLIDGEDVPHFAKKDTTAENLKIRFFKKQNGREVLVEDLNPLDRCSTADNFDIKITQITDPGFINAKEGDITRIINDRTREFVSIFRSDSFKIKIWVYDSEGNQSNIIESPDMILPPEALEVMESPE